MKTLKITFIAFFCTSVAWAQSPEKALAKVSYSFSHIRDTTNRANPYTENMALLIGKNASVYASFDKITQDIERKRQLEEQVKNLAPGEPIRINVGKVKPTSAVEFYSFFKENKLFTRELLINIYLTEEPLPKISWKITKDTASFSGIACKKATAHFKGRNWTAWFAPELPFQSGPWKLNGLPGLIIEAYDDKKEVQFLFAGFENIKEEVAEKPALDPENTIVATTSALAGKEIKLPTNAIRTTVSELNKLKEARAKDPVGFVKAQMANSGVTISSTNKLAEIASKNTFNNPIELPEHN
ncbi:GLPGLI family protein [Pedobacter sp. KR3-3]|uniref:GLPGLI family protein n=1 Tax=Pedobacter albus TaxID=3113905 RepID=A0ABU7I3P5_9SPHI|nr:GLPGLI family protein [Pedobacter sp. KR3-3]MEE1943946.1 GLPGLI family protein [Pedobacter sp. KR3-3]